MLFLAALFLSFGLGSVPTAYLFARKLRNVDIRDFGSGNVGATNAARVLGKKMGVLVLSIDFMKGLAPVLIYAKLGGPGDLTPWVGVAAILGHIFTPFLGFRGGKGIATGGGTVLGCYPAVFLAVIGAWIAVFVLSRIVSLSTLAALTVLLIYGMWAVPQAWDRAYFFVLFILGLWTHRENLQRLWRGEEKPIR